MVGFVVYMDIERERERRGGRNGTYLSASGRVLRCSSGDELRSSIRKQVLVETHVLVLGEDGIIGFEAIFLQ